MNFQPKLALLAFVAVAITAGHSEALALKLASWNMEHLADTDGEGCRPRTPADYQALKQHADKLKADVIAVQEIENEQALARVFDPAQWNFEVAGNRDQENARECNGLSGKFVITQRVGFVIRKGIPYTRNPDLADLDIDRDNRLRYGVDVTLEAGYPVRLLAVHLKSGCPSAPPTSSDGDCKVLFRQQPVLKDWVTKRAEDQIPFALLGDFNRRLQDEEDFWKGIDAPGDPLKDLSLAISRDRMARCQPNFPKFIDFLVFNNESLALVRKDSFDELTYEGPAASDHCPVSVELTVPDFAELDLSANKQAGAAKQMTTGLRWYRRSAEFRMIAEYIYGQAVRRVDAIRDESQDGKPWVVSLDADETLFDNSLGQLENEYLGLGYDEARWQRWERRGAAQAVPGAIAFMNHVLQSGGKIAIITNRVAGTEEVARQNLVRLGLDDDRRKVCILGRSPADRDTPANKDEWARYNYKNDKDSRRRLVSEGNAVGCWVGDPSGAAKASWHRPQRFALWVGDNVLDLPFATQEGARNEGTPNLTFGRDYFLLPNPLYGSWQKNKP